MNEILMKYRLLSAFKLNVSFQTPEFHLHLHLLLLLQNKRRGKGEQDTGYTYTGPGVMDNRMLNSRLRYTLCCCALFSTSTHFFALFHVSLFLSSSSTDFTEESRVLWCIRGCGTWKVSRVHSRVHTVGVDSREEGRKKENIRVKYRDEDHGWVSAAVFSKPPHLHPATENDAVASKTVREACLIERMGCREKSEKRISSRLSSHTHRRPASVCVSLSDVDCLPHEANIDHREEPGCNNFTDWQRRWSKSDGWDTSYR